jgi:hypothetical protein
MLLFQTVYSAKRSKLRFQTVRFAGQLTMQNVWTRQPAKHRKLSVRRTMFIGHMAMQVPRKPRLVYCQTKQQSIIMWLKHPQLKKQIRATVLKMQRAKLLLHRLGVTCQQTEQCLWLRRFSIQLSVIQGLRSWTPAPSEHRQVL